MSQRFNQALLELTDLVSVRLGDVDGLASVLGRHPTVHRVVCGHVHRAIFAVLGGVGIFTAPSTYLQMELDFRATSIRLASRAAFSTS